MHTAIRELARRRPKQSIIVRPHPGEDLKRWDGLFAEYPNVSIIREGAHIPWTLACRVLLHTSCTTGFEAQVAGKAALSLVPRPSWITASLLSNQVNATFDDPIEFVAAAEKILDGGAAPSPKPAAKPPEYYIWNCGAHNATQRIADLLVQGLPPPKAVAFAPLTTIARDEKLKSKFDVSLMRCSQAIQSVRDTRKFSQDIAVQELGDSLFAVAPTGQIRINLAPKLDQKQIRAAMDTALRGGNFKQAFDIFKQNFGEAHRNSELCFMAGVACFELGDYALALQYLQHATIPDSNAVNLNIVFMLARTYQKLGEFETARRYIELAYRQVPTSPIFFSLLKELSAAAGKPVPQHWVVIGCSHVRYFRYIQVNQPRFFDGRVHLECYEFAGATAYGLGNPASDSGALKATRELQPRIALADRVLIYFGEIDCRRAAWKAAVTSGRSIDETIAESVAHLKTYIEREILPHNKTVLLLGPKPQIIGDDDFYKNALEDERTIFKPLEEREKVALGFNRQLGTVAGKLKIDYADIDDVLASDASRRNFFAHAFWDHYEDDTHGNVDHFARLYFDKLKAFCQ